MGWLGCSRSGSGRQHRRSMRLRCHRRMGTCGWMRSRPRMGRSRWMRSRRRMGCGRWMNSHGRTSPSRWMRSRRRMSPGRWNRRNRRTCSRRRMSTRCRMRSRWMSRVRCTRGRGRTARLPRGSELRRCRRVPRRTGRLRCSRAGHGGPGRRRQTGTRGARLGSRRMWRHWRCPRGPPWRRGRRPRRSRPSRRRGGSLTLVVILRTQVLPQRELPERRSLERHHRRWRRGGPRPGLVLALLFVAQELAGSEPAEHALLLRIRLERRGTRGCRSSRSPRGRRGGRSSRKPCTSPCLGRLRVQLDVPLRADDPVALLHVEVEPQLRDDARDDAQPREERQLVHRRHVEGARHRELQAAPVHQEREHEVLLDLVRRDEAERSRRHGLELRDRRLRITRLLREHRPQRLDVQVLQLDQVGPQPGAIDHLGLEGLVELPLVDEALADQDRAELFRHEGLDSRRLP